MPRRCLHGVHPGTTASSFPALSLPRRCLHGVHPARPRGSKMKTILCLGAACTGCIAARRRAPPVRLPLPRRCLHGVHPRAARCRHQWCSFASALPARGASVPSARPLTEYALCLGAACTGCIVCFFGLLLVDFLCLGAACTGCICCASARDTKCCTLPRRCLHGVHLDPERYSRARRDLCLGAACTGCI